MGGRRKQGRGRIWLLLPLGAAAAAALYLGAASPWWLDLRFALGTWLAPYTKVVELDVEQVPGLRMFLNPDDAIVTTAILRDGLWEETETYWTVRMLDEGDTFVDVGANVGYYTLLASRLVGPEGRVYAFEPDPVSFEILRRNVRLNRLENVVLEEKALSNEAGTLQLFLAEKNKGDHRTYPTGDGRLAIDVEAVTLDAYARSIDGPIDFVKIDTQGAEGFILQGMRRVLRENPDLALAIEFWPYMLERLYDAEAIVEMLREHDFAFFNLGAGGWVSELRLVDDARLGSWLRPPIVENENWFTNLLLVKGRGEMQRLTAEIESRERELEAAAAELAEARRAWEERQRSRVAAGAGLPRALAAALRTPPEERRPAQTRRVAEAFAVATPLLEERRARLAEARARLRALQTEMLRGAPTR